MYYIYMLRCEDNSIYTGIASNPNKRMKEHFSKDVLCAKYTKSHNAKCLEALWSCENRSLASKLEYQIKQLNKIKKETFIQTNDFPNIFQNKLEPSYYHRENLSEHLKGDYYERKCSNSDITGSKQ